MAEQFADKTHEATPHRRQQAREQGQVAKSQDLASAVVLLGALLLLKWFGSDLARFFWTLTTDQLGGSAWLRADSQLAVHQAYLLAYRLGTVLIPLLLLLAVVAAAGHIGQTGLLFVPQKAGLDPSRLSLLKGLQRIFSLNNSARLGFGLFKIVIVAGVGLLTIWLRRAELLAVSASSVASIAQTVLDLLLTTCLNIAVALLALALLDFLFQRWKHEQDLRMTTQEVREEMKSLQGDPQVIARRRQIQRQLVSNRLSSAVPTADVVVTNPTEFAVALRYDPESTSAPVVVAKGAGVLAQRIRQLALEAGIPIQERKPLARALYEHVDVAAAVPSEHYAAVAEVLRYVYELNGRPLPRPAA